MKYFLLWACVCLSLAAQDNGPRKVHDKEHNDDHAWNAAEDSAWRRYLSDRHRTYHDFSKATDKEEKDYWKWRHGHPDK